jgi:hypothetical protein
MNIWTEGGDVVFYLCRSGSFDENNTLLKAGRFRIRLTPALQTGRIRQTLHLNDGYVSLTDGETTVAVWADVFRPVVHVEVNGNRPVTVKAEYENWRTADRLIDRREGQQCSYKWTVPAGLVTSKDSIRSEGNTVTFWHRNPAKTVFDVVVAQQGLEADAGRLYNPIGNLITGGRMTGSNGAARRYHHVQIALANVQGSIADFEQTLQATEQQINVSRDRRASRRWWQAFWQRSYIEAGGEAAGMARNYTLFRYMLGCNAKGLWPTKFNGGLFTFDPQYADSASVYTPDFRKWGGGTHTAQNQRLVYWPMLASGDADMMPAQFDYYHRILNTAEVRSRTYWGHGGGCFAEQIENFGLPNPAEYGNKRPEYFDKGVEYNAWLEYEWDTVLEFCQMILLAKSYAGMDIDKYLPLIRSALAFFDEHYRYLARQRGRHELDGNGKLVIYPGSACETYKMAYNPSSTIAALRTVLTTYMEIDTAKVYRDMLNRIPEIPLRSVAGRQMIAPAVAWERVNNVETPQLYPVFPWRIYGVGMPGIETARNTYLYDPDAIKFRSAAGWKQDNIWAACLGLTDEAVRLTKEKMADGPYRFPAFWPPGYDWAPDHNRGGSGMLGLQMMLLQESGGKIRLFPAWPKEWDVRFKLHAGKQTTVEATLKEGKVTELKVTPKEREKDVVVDLPRSE